MNSRLTAAAAARQKMKEDLNVKTKQLLKDMEDAEVPLVQLGDASIASPFTSKSSAVYPGTTISCNETLCSL